MNYKMVETLHRLNEQYEDIIEILMKVKEIVAKQVVMELKNNRDELEKLEKILGFKILGIIAPKTNRYGLTRVFILGCPKEYPGYYEANERLRIVFGDMVEKTIFAGSIDCRVCPSKCKDWKLFV